MRDIAHIADFERGAGRQLTLYAHVVLIGDWGVQMRIHEECAFTGVDG